MLTKKEIGAVKKKYRHQVININCCWQCVHFCFIARTTMKCTVLKINTEPDCMCEVFER
jgi:hypothetical protein